MIDIIKVYAQSKWYMGQNKRVEKGWRNTYNALTHVIRKPSYELLAFFWSSKRLP